ncbi:tetraspanin 35 [Nelusetta ayraudi]|uniref:tetraspanin 35 n=1 Tax=Nelusetta ayraudi TaxID=303726 RepID=UPI003F6F862D
MGCFGFLKVMMFVFNGIIFLAGCTILGVGIWVKVDSGSIFHLFGQIENAPAELSQVLSVGYLLIALGSFLLIIGFLGSCGVIRESKCLLLLFFTIVLLVFIAEVAGAVVILVFKPLVGKLFAKLGRSAVESIRKDYGRNSDITGLWDAIMTTLKCCGLDNSTDFVGSPYFVEHGLQFPPSCCQGNNQPCNQTAVDSTLTTVGCFQKIQELVEDNAGVCVGVALGFAALETPPPPSC